jgi:hypothetical protein
MLPIFRNLIPKLEVNPPDKEALRVFLTLPLFGIFENPKLCSELHCPFSRNLIRLSKSAWAVTEKWISELKSDYMLPYVKNLKASRRCQALGPSALSFRLSQLGHKIRTYGS